MEVKFKFSIYNIVTTKTGKTGIVTNLGVGKHGVPRLYIEYKAGKSCWEFESACTIVDNCEQKSTHIDFYFNPMDKVKSPLSEGIITAMDIGASDKVSCFIANDQRGVADDWWPASSLKLIKE